MEPGLLPEQIEPAGRAVSKDIDDTVRDYIISQKTEVATADEMREVQEAKARFDGSNYKNGVGAIMATAQSISDKAESKKYIQENIAKFKSDSREALKTGMPKKKMGDIFLEGLSGLNPLNVIGTAITTRLSGGSFFGSILATLNGAIINSIKDTAVAYGGDMLAARMKTFKNNHIDSLVGKGPEDGPMTEERAARELAAANAAQNLAQFLQIDAANNPGAVSALASRIMQGEPETVAPASTPATSSLPENVLASAREEKQAAGAQATQDPDFHAANGVTPAGGPGQTPQRQKQAPAKGAVMPVSPGAAL